MNVLTQILAFVIVFGIIVLVHELGHFMAARLMGVRVEVFSFGIGKRLVGKRFGDTDLRLSAIPLGGFVRMAGEETHDPDNIKPDEFPSKNRGQKFFILIMGSVMNILLAFFIITLVNVTGTEKFAYKYEPPILGFVAEDSPAARAGLQKGDRILTINGQKIDNWEALELTIGANPNERLQVEYRRGNSRMETVLEVETANRYSIGEAGLYWDYRTKIVTVSEGMPADRAGLNPGDVILAVDGDRINYFELGPRLAANAGKELSLTVLREGSERQVRITPEEHEGKGRIGIEMTLYSPMKKARYGLFAAMGNGVEELKKLTYLTFNAFKKILVGKLSPKSLSGPIEIAKFSQQAMKSGLSSFFILIAFISLQLGIINLFPIPVLDGGHLMILSIETVIRRDLSQKVKNILMNAGFFLLVALMIFVVLNDVAKVLPNGWKSLIPF